MEHLPVARANIQVCRRSFLRLLPALLVSAWPRHARPAAQSLDVAALIEAMVARLDARVAPALARIDGTGRRLLALRSYLRAGSGLAARWSWTGDEIASFAQSTQNRTLQAEIERVRQAFADANPGFELWVNPEVRSLDIQLDYWNSNASVARAASALVGAFGEWLSSSAPASRPDVAVVAAAEEFLRAHVPTPTPTLAAPGLSRHGQMRAIDFQIRRDGVTIAGPQSATIDSVWDAGGWTRKLNAAVRAGSKQFTGPLEFPREPWHYTYSPGTSAPAPP